MAPEILYREDQRFRGTRGWWLFVAISLAGGAMVLWLTARTLDLEAGWRAALAGQPLTAAALAAFVVSAIGLVFLFYRINLQVEVNDFGLFLRFAPFHRKVRRIDLDGVIGVHAVQYRPVREYGGYGIRVRRHGRAYNLSGIEGVRIDYENGYHVLIGSRHALDLCAAIEAVLPEDAEDAADDGPEQGA